MTVEEIECKDAAFLASFQEGPHHSESKMANSIIVDIVNYLMLLQAYSQQLILNFYFLSLG